MKQAPATTAAQSVKGEFKVFRELADTAWRIAVPVLLFSVGGLLLDKKLGSQPWLTLLGMLLGFVFAALLIKQQLKRVNAS